MSRKINLALILTAFTAVLLVFAGGIVSTGYAQGQREGAAAPLLNHLTPTASPTPTRTPSRTPSRTPPPTPRPTSPSSLVFSYDEIYFSVPGGGGSSCPDWETLEDELPANTSLPYVWTDIFDSDMRTLCVYGFPPDQEITVDLYTPDGKKAAVFTDQATTAFNERELAFYMPYSLPYGNWTVEIRGGNSVIRGTFAHPPREDATIDINHILSGEVLHPDDPRWRMGYKQGDRVGVYGAGFRANSEISVVVTHSLGGSELQPLIGWTVQTNSRGDFNIQFTIDRSYTDGRYVVLANPTSGRSLDDGEWFTDSNLHLRVFTPWRACQSGPLSNLHKGDSARLSAGLTNNLRSQPRLTGRQIGQIQPFQDVNILDGPMCSDGLTWWYVEVRDFYAENHGLKGWTAEGNASGYWLLPSQ